MVEIKFCPSTLAEGYNTYSPQAVKRLFDGKKVSPFLDFNINELKQSNVIAQAMQRISVSGVQEKFSGLIDHNSIRIAESNERSTYIIKPAPWDETIATRKQIPANEHVTMQIARQEYGIVTAENGIKRVLDKYMLVPELYQTGVGQIYACSRTDHQACW